MFTSLHALAKQATLMITIAAEGDDQLRVNVAPVPADTKTKAKLPQPLSLLATPAEFDADFIAALATWQAPKRSLLQQAQDAVGGAAPALPAPKADAKGDGKNDKPARKGRAGKSGDDDKRVDAIPGAAAAAGEAAAAADEAMSASASTDACEQLPVGAVETSTSADGVQDQSQQPVDGDEVAEAGADVDAAPTAESADGPKEAPPEPPAGDEPVDKFTLDLF